jgi:nucleoside-diphosphate-sugar epimerase
MTDSPLSSESDEQYKLSKKNRYTNNVLTNSRGDVTEPFSREAVGSVDRIYHLACPASPKRFPENPLGILETCFKGTQNVLELAAHCGARVLLASTSGIYSIYQFPVITISFFSVPDVKN